MDDYRRDIEAYMDRNYVCQSDKGMVSMADGRDINFTASREIAIDDYSLKHKESGYVEFYDNRPHP